MCWAEDGEETPELPSALDIEEPHLGLVFMLDAQQRCSLV